MSLLNYRIINGLAYPSYNIDNLNSSNNVRESVRHNIKKENFEMILNENLKGDNCKFKVSKHAGERLKQLGFNKLDYKNLESGIEKARIKGSKNTVLFYKGVAVVVSIENSTLITAIGLNRAEENVFTNIDSAVIL